MSRLKADAILLAEMTEAASEKRRGYTTRSFAFMCMDFAAEPWGLYSYVSDIINTTKFFRSSLPNALRADAKFAIFSSMRVRR